MTGGQPVTANDAQRSMDLLIEHAYVVTMDGARTVIADGAVAVHDGHIVAVGDQREVAARFAQAGQRINARGKMLMPGLVDSHCHLGLDVAGAIQAASGAHWGLFPATAQNGVFNMGGDLAGVLRYGDLSPLQGEAVYWAALNALIKLIRSGVTCVFDGGSPDPGQVLRALADSRLRGSIGSPMLDLQPDSGGNRLRRSADADELLAQAETFAASCGIVADSRVMPALGLLMGVGCSDELVTGAVSLAARLDCPLYSHLATVKNEAAFCRQHFGLAPVQRFEALGALNQHFLGIHMGWVEESDLPRLAASGSQVVHCPQAAARLAHGIYSQGMIPRMLDAGINLGLGSDVTALGDMLQMMQVASSVAKDVSLDVTQMDAPDVLAMATRGGARCARREASIGSIEEGRFADLVLINIERAHYFPRADPVRVFVEAARSDDIRTVIVGGQTLLDDGEFVILNEAEVRNSLASSAAELGRRLAASAA